MKPGMSSLNPYAASYIPLSRREADDRTYVAEKDFKIHDVWYQTPQQITEDQHFLDSSTHAAKNFSSPEAFYVKSHSASTSYSSSQNVTEVIAKQLLDEESDIDLEYLKVKFPSISDQSLFDVYMVNNGDLDAAMDMLSQLEFDGVESSGNLPETLDIGDVSEAGSPADSASLKLKNVAAEACTSSSHLASTNVW